MVGRNPSRVESSFTRKVGNMQLLTIVTGSILAILAILVMAVYSVLKGPRHKNTYWYSD